MDNSALYLDLYDALVDDADYLQADSDKRHILPEALIIGAVGSALATFATSFFGRLGERAADGTATKALSLFRRAERTADRDELIEALDLLRPHLGELRRATEAVRRVEELAIAQTLRERGFPEAAAHEVAGRVLDVLREAAPDEDGGAA